MSFHRYLLVFQGNFCLALYWWLYNYSKEQQKLLNYE